MIKILIIAFSILSASSCVNLDKKIFDTKKECNKNLEKKIFKTRSEMLEKCFHPKILEYYEDKHNQQKIASILVGTQVNSTEIDLLLAAMSKEIEIEKRIESKKITREQGRSELTEYFIELNNIDILRNRVEYNTNYQNQNTYQQSDYPDYSCKKTFSGIDCSPSSNIADAILAPNRAYSRGASRRY